MILLVDKYIHALVVDESISRKIMTIILVEHNDGCFHFQWKRKKEMNPLNLSSHLQNKTVHYKLFCMNIMSTYNRINRDDQGFKKD
jgi:hypothetical protein